MPKFKNAKNRVVFLIFILIKQLIVNKLIQNKKII